MNNYPDVERPWLALPSPIPKEGSPPDLGWFYRNIGKPLIKDSLKLMMNGLPIDMNKVRELDDKLVVILNDVQNKLNNNPIIEKYMASRNKGAVEEYVQEQASKIKNYTEFVKPFKHNNMDHRSYFMQAFSVDKDITPPEDTISTGIPKWTTRAVKALVPRFPGLQSLIDGTVFEENNQFVRDAMKSLAEDKAEMYNRRFGYHDNIAKAKKDGLDLPPFNPASPDQKHDVLTGMLGYESEKLTDAYIDYERAINRHLKWGAPRPEEPKNKYSWNRENLERILELSKDPDEQELLQALADYSMGAIIKNNFIESFYKFSILYPDGQHRLHGTYKLLGAKTGRFTSSDPNMLNSPSTGSVYAKPIKECFTAPPGYVAWTIDYASLT